MHNTKSKYLNEVTSFFKKMNNRKRLLLPTYRKKYKEKKQEVLKRQKRLHFMSIAAFWKTSTVSEKVRIRSFSGLYFLAFGLKLALLGHAVQLAMARKLADKPLNYSYSWTLAEKTRHKVQKSNCCWKTTGCSIMKIINRKILSGYF